MDKYNISTGSMLNELKNFLLPKGDKRVLVVTLVYDVSIYSPEEINEYIKIDIMFYNPNNYCKVACRIDNTNFKLVADHDSSWSEGVNRCLDMAFEDLDNKFTDSVNRVLGSSVSIERKDVSLYKKVEGFKFIDNPEIKILEDSYDSPLETNF